MFSMNSNLNYFILPVLYQSIYFIFIYLFRQLPLLNNKYFSIEFLKCINYYLKTFIFIYDKIKNDFEYLLKVIINNNDNSICKY